jgi:shikimate kinase
VALVLTDAHRIEIVGLAGTGKSTLVEALLDRHHDWRVADFIHARTPSHFRYFVHSTPGIVGLVAHGFGRPATGWEEVKMYVYASEWHRYLRAHPEYESGVTLLDQGPLFALARLLWGGGAVTRSSWFRSWKSRAVARWTLELDTIVELTAPDHVLFERINEREKKHPAKGKSARETVDILGEHRRAYADVLEEVERSGHVRLLRFDTSKRSLEEVAGELSDALSPRASTALDAPASDTQRTTEAPYGSVRDEIERLGSIG